MTRRWSVVKMDVRVQLLEILIFFTVNTEVFIEGMQIKSSENLIPCKEGWFLFGEKCYKVLGQNAHLTWEEASKNCILRSGHLATIYNEELQDFLTSFLLLNEPAGLLWIGLNDRDGHFTWDDSSIVNYTYWDIREPSMAYDRKKEDCVEMRLKSKGEIGMWNDSPCDSERPYICQTNKSEQVQSPDPRFCPMGDGGGWKYLNSCYHIVTDEKSWEDAEDYCQEKFKGHLVTILNPAALLFLDYILSNFSMEFWIGIKIREHALQRWSSGWHVVFNRWDDEQDPFIQGNCALRSREKLWISTPCLERHPFVCETSGNKPPAYKQVPEGWTCPNFSKDWKDLDGDTCYIIETTKPLKWYEANYACMSKGGSLARIHSEEESKALHLHVLNTHERLLIGLHRNMSNKNIFEWVDGSKIDYLNWKDGEPNSYKEECGELWTDTMEWNDISCYNEKGYICSAKKLPPVPLNLNDEYESALNENLQAEKPNCSSDSTVNNAWIAVICTLIICILIGVVIYLFKPRCAKNYKFLALKDFN